jgi:hypothetical protein
MQSNIVDVYLLGSSLGDLLSRARASRGLSGSSCACRTPCPSRTAKKIPSASAYRRHRLLVCAVQQKNQSTQKLRETGSLRDGALLDHESVLQDYDDTYMDTEITTTIPLLTVNFSQPRVLVIHWFRL